MATALLAPPSVAPTAVLTGMATLVLVRSPIRGADDQLRVARSPLSPGQTVRESIPPCWHDAKILWNGGTLTPEAQTQVIVQPGDEVWVLPTWGYVPGLYEILIYAAISIAIGIATTALTYVLFPPSKPHVQTAEEPTFSWEGIRTAIGPGQPVPIIYGTFRVGGQLLSAAVDEANMIVDNPASAAVLPAITTPASLSMLIALGEGPIDNIDVNSILINDQPIGNFPGVQVFLRPGTPDQTVIPEFAEIRNSFADGRAIPFEPGATNAWIQYTTTTAVDAFTLNIEFLQGLFHMDGQGNKEVNTVVIGYRWQTDSGPPGPWIRHPVTADHTAPVRLAFRQQFLAHGVQTISVQYTDVRHADDRNSQWQPTLATVTEITYGATAYPNTALLGLRALATDALQGAIPNVTVQVRGRTVRMGSFLPVETWTDNHAWCLMDFLTNDRYGLGIPDAEIDLAAFQAYATYCFEPVDGEARHIFNYVLDRDARAQTLLLEMMGGSRTILVKSQGLWHPRPTRNDPPIQLLSWTNCANVKLTYLRDADRLNVMEARFANEETDFQQDVLTWPTIDNWPSPMRKGSLEVRGVTKPSRIMRAMQFELNRRHFENLTLEMDCALDAVVLQLHDIFRFSHPLPGWGVSGRVQAGSTTSSLILDEDVVMLPGVTYQVYLRNQSDFTEARVVYNPSNATPTRTLLFLTPFSQAPQPRTTLWAFGQVTNDTAIKLFRVTKMQRKSDTTVHIEAVIHNPSIYDEPIATPLPVTSSLFNPLGPPPPLVSLVLTEVTRIQPNGASLRVVNVSWDVAGLSTGFAPYGGVKILRRTVLSSGLAGAAQAGTVDLGAIQDPADPNVGFIPITQIRGHVLDWDDYTVISGLTYVYRVIPISQGGVPNVLGELDAVIHVAGPTTPDFFPGTVQNLRLLGQPVGNNTFEGHDIHFAWDPVADSPLFTASFFIQDYLVQIWAPGQSYLMRSTTVPVGPPHGEVHFTYTYQENYEDQVRNGMPLARRDVELIVWARTNTGRISLDPAKITVVNPPPDMSNIQPEAIGLFEAALISWNEFAEPRDFDHYEVRLDLVTPPLTIYQDVSIAFRKIFPANLTPQSTYYIQIVPYDTFGIGIPSAITSFVPVALTADSLDSVPPATPTGLALTTGTTVSPDGTVQAWVQASWTISPESDVAGYEVQFRVGTNITPTVFSPGPRSQTSVRLESVPGNVLITVRMAAFDRFHNVSPFTSDVSITTSMDGSPPAAPTNLVAVGSIKSIALLWTPPADADYAYSEVWTSTVNDRATAAFVGTGLHGFVHDGLGPNQTWYFWVRAVDTSGNVSTAFFPASATAGISATAGQLDTSYISSLAADSIIAGTIQALVHLGVNNIDLDGVNSAITVRDTQPTPFTRVLIGRLGTLNTSYGMRIFNAAGQLMWNFTDGAQTPGISDASITSTKIAAATVTATHLRTDTAVITTAAQIANAIINDAHIANLGANKIIAGTITAQISLGVGNAIFLDGPGRQILITDLNGITRVKLGRFGPGPADYSIAIFDFLGNLMWDPSTGAQTAGIGPSSVITEKVFVNAITDALIFSGAGGGVASGSETTFASITTPMDTGDQLWIVATANISGNTPGAQTTMLIREDSGAGAAYSQSFTDSVKATLACQALFTAGSPQGGKVFVVTAIGQGSISNVQLVALRRRR